MRNEETSENRNETSGEPLLEVSNLTISYDGMPMVRNVSFCLGDGEILGIAGESGSGKSTLIRAIMGILGKEGEILSGEIRYRGKSLTDMPEKERQLLRGKEMGMVFQDSKASLCPVRKIGPQILDMMRAHGKISKKEAYAKAAGIMEKTGLTNPGRILNSYPFELSGGMNQRVGICMAMLLNPGLLLADEPTSALDVTVQKQVVEELLLMRKEYGTSMILVTHNIGVLHKMADQILVMKDGCVVEASAADRVLEQPENEYTRELIDAQLHVKTEYHGEQLSAGNFE